MMIIQESSNQVESSGSMDSKKFSIKMSSKTFAVLAGLYPNKPEAIIRELACNGLDAQIRNGNPERKLQIHLPNYSDTECYFEVRDFGCSMSHEFMTNRFTTVFDSDKSDSNCEIGAFGLGKLSPLSISNSFTVSCIQNSEKRIYAVYLENGFPTLSLISKMSTDEEQGTIIQVPIEAKHIEDFTSSAQKIFRIWDVLPEFTGQNINISKYSYLIEGNCWKVSKDSYKFQAVMGNIAYDIDTNEIPQMSYKDRDFFRNVHLFFNVGELNIMPDRKHLSYDEFTKNNILNKIENCKANYKELLISKLKDKTEFEVKKMVLLDNSAIYGSIAEVYDHKFIHDGYNIFTPSIETLELNGYKNSFVRINRKDKKYGKSILSQKVNDSKLYIINSNTYKFIIKNNDKNLEAKVKQESEKHDNEKVTYYIVPQNVVDFLKIPNEMILDSDKLTYTPTIKASGIKANINKKYKLLSSNRKPNTRDYKVNIVDNDSGKGFFEKRMGKTIYYICLNTTEADKLVDGTECNVLNIYSFLSDIAFTYLKGIGLGSIIIVDSKRDAKDGWVDLIQYCKENIYKSFNVSFGEKVKLFAGNAHFGYMSDTENNLKLLKGVIGEDHKFFSFFGQESNFDSNAISLDRLKESFKMLGIEFESVSSYALFEEYILQNYPMIDLLGSYEIPNHINNIGNYIKGMDLLKNN